MARRIRDVREGPLVQIIVVDRVPAHRAHEPVRVVQTGGIPGGEERGHDSAFRDDEVGEFGEEVRCVSVRGEDDVAGFDDAAGCV